ncbi:hypothetical protein C798_23795 [Herbaspirillum rubrisubalbicans Os34]|uniref:Abi-like protein n=2 Tax=Herbaspirillum rubrisubalbicans TaxID=80842 RepID=A0A6M3ZWY0_9BURK|nr:hypothetical protein C798_23795 [Herbaspirillum rubrisubalbicans Os34]
MPMLKHITAPRLSTLQRFFMTTSQRDALGCYAWNQAIGAGMLPILGDFEVALRNALHRALSQYFGAVDSFGWMMPRPNPAHAINPAAPALLPPIHKLTPKSRDDVVSAMEKVKAKKPMAYMVSPDDVVAALPFGFWEVLIGGLAHHSQPRGLQSAILASVFPHAPDIAAIAYGSQVFKKRVVDLLKRIRDVRNRIGHHDALWSTPEFNHFGVLGHIPRRPRHTINSLRRFVDNISWFAGWIDPDITTYLHNSDHWWSLQVLLDRRALAIYRHSGGVAGTYRSILDAAELPVARLTLRRKPWSRQPERACRDRYFY